MQSYFKIPSNVFNYGLSPPQLSVYVYLSKVRRNDTSQAWPSMATIARECMIGTTTARLAINVLCERNLITKAAQYIEGKGGKRRRTSNLYTILKTDSTTEFEVGYNGCGGTPAQITEGGTSADGGEIYRTKYNITTLNKLSSSNYKNEDDEKFREILDDCYFHPDRDKNYPTSEIKKLARQTMEKLWNTEKITVDGICYKNAQIRDFLFSDMCPDDLDYAINAFMKADDVRCQVPYLATCIMYAIINRDVIVNRDYLNYINQTKRRNK